MTAITYVAKRSVDPSRTVGLEYSFDVGMTLIDKDRKVDINRHVSLSGVPENYLNKLDIIWNFKTIALEYNSAEYIQFAEFLDSVCGGELFYIDPYGTVAVPDSPLSVEKKDDGTPESRDGVTDYIGFTLACRIIE